MSTLTAPAVDLAALTLAGLHMTQAKAACLQIGDIVSLSGDWVIENGRATS